MKDFTLNAQNADAWRGFLIACAASPSFGDCSAITLPGALELFSTAIALGPSSDLFRKITDRSEAGDVVWKTLMTEWTRPNLATLSGELHGTRVFEFFRLRTIDDKVSDNFSLFLERFCRSSKGEGFPPKFANALAKVADEMADNVVQHSATAEPFSGIAAYHVQEKRGVFCVADIGRGILARLRDSPRWAHLKSAREALRAIASKGASSRSDQGAGEGFKQLFGSLVDHNCIVRLRTDDCVLTVAEGMTDREGGELTSPPLAGLQVSISCAVGVRAEEFKIKY